MKVLYPVPKDVLIKRILKNCGQWCVCPEEVEIVTSRDMERMGLVNENGNCLYHQVDRDSRTRSIKVRRCGKCWRTVLAVIGIGIGLKELP